MKNFLKFPERQMTFHDLWGHTFKIKYLCIHNISIHINFYQNQFRNESVRKNFLKFPERRSFLWDVEELTLLIRFDWINHQRKLTYLEIFKSSENITATKKYFILVLVLFLQQIAFNFCKFNAYFCWEYALVSRGFLTIY